MSLQMIVYYVYFQAWYKKLFMPNYLISIAMDDLLLLNKHKFINDNSENSQNNDDHILHIFLDENNHFRTLKKIKNYTNNKVEIKEKIERNETIKQMENQNQLIIDNDKNDNNDMFEFNCEPLIAEICENIKKITVICAIMAKMTLVFYF